MDILHTTVEVNNLSIHVMMAGQGEPPLILLHGGGVDSAALSWGGVMPELARERRVVAWDFPGYGESDLPKEPVTAAFLVDFVARTMDRLDIERAVLAGLSMGGSAALGFALQFPERTAGLVLVDSYGIQRSMPLHLLSALFVRLPGINKLMWSMMRSRAMAKYTLNGMLKRPGALTDALIDQAYAEIQRPNAGKAWMDFQNSEVTWTSLRTCYFDRFAEIRVPVLIVHGEKDTLVPLRYVREAHERISGSKLVWIESSGHWSQRDHPEAFVQALRDWLRENYGSSDTATPPST